MRKIREISDEEDNFRTVPFFNDGNHQMFTFKRDSIKPEPEGTVILLPFRIVGYDPDCDGSLMARLDNLYFYDGSLEDSGWSPSKLGLSIGAGFVVTEDELLSLFKEAT